jgi:Fe-S oxidoreductase
MARMKLEFTAHYKARHGHTLRDRLIAHLPSYAHAASHVAPLLNLRNRSPRLARWAERWTGFSARRPLPHWRRDTFWRTRGRLGLADADAVLRADKGVVLWVDTFNGSFETENARAAVRVLQAAGYTVHVPQRRGASGHLCCGRTWLTTGMVDIARARAAELVDALRPFAEQGLTIVGLEPSCLLSLRDELQVLGLGEAARTVGARAMLFEEFLAGEAKAGRFAPPWRPAQRPMRVHGHCHQKAFGAMAPVLEVLRLIPGAQPELIESSCCGMAGSFGLEVEHHAISLQMAEADLLPALRAAPDAIVVADGTSCRHQIADAGAREALHVARVLADHLACKD